MNAVALVPAVPSVGSVVPPMPIMPTSTQAKGKMFAATIEDALAETEVVDNI